MEKEESLIFSTAISRFAQIRDVVSEVDDMLKTKIKIEKLDVSPAATLMLGKSSWLDYLLNNMRHKQLSVDFPNMLWSSLFFTTFATFEAVLDSLSYYHHMYKKINIGPNDLKDSGIKRSKKYLIKLADLKYPKDSQPWDEIEKLVDIRHCLMHANGNVKIYKNSKKIFSIINKYSKSKIEIIDDFIVLKKEFVMLFTNLCHKFLIGLWQINA